MAVNTTIWGELRRASCTVDLVEPVESSRLAGGQLITASLGDPFWTITADLVPAKPGPASAAESVLRNLSRPGGRLTAFDPTANGPASDPGGVLLGTASVVIASLPVDGVSMTISGLPAGYALTAGDWLGVTVADVPQLYRLAADATANASGVTPAFEVSPAPRHDVTTGLAVTLVRPVMLAQITQFQPGERRPGIAAGGRLVLQQVFS